MDLNSAKLPEQDKEVQVTYCMSTDGKPEIKVVFFFGKKISVLKIFIETPSRQVISNLTLSFFFASAGKCRRVERSALCRSREFAKATEEVTCYNYCI